MDMMVIAHILRAIGWLLFALFLLALATMFKGSGISFVLLLLSCGAGLQGMVFLMSNPKTRSDPDQ